MKSHFYLQFVLGLTIGSHSLSCFTAGLALVLFCASWPHEAAFADRATYLPRIVVFEAANGDRFRLLIERLVNKGVLSSTFGTRASPLGGSGKDHRGIDIAAKSGSPVRAATSGVVVTRGFLGSYGLAIRIRHSPGLETLYAHLSGFSTRARVGHRVKRGEIIGYVGTTGRSTGAHLHFEVHRNGTPIDPLALPHERK